MKAARRTFDSLRVGDSASFDRLITEEDMSSFAAVSGDRNPLHLDDAFAGRTEMGTRVVYGMLLGAFVSRLVGMDLPGEMSLLLQENLTFRAPARIGDTVSVSGTIVRKSIATRVVELDIKVARLDEVLVSGKSLVRLLQ